ncbi:MAG: hypothetical protein NVS4B9_18320 [Ktedonobacteraceae bacterium]
MDAVGPDDYACLLCDGCSAGGMATDASHLIAVHEDLLHREAFPQFDASLHGSFNEDSVQHFAPGSIPHTDTVDGRG